ncbi:TIGR01620 family protein [Aggregatibacter actinomycetemcomitans]|uniref:TIGR01620 family protein n=1 Tax=Aggregatibacter actinomycetemcomitans TaxID=714 RepID=UPI000D64F7E0|nr:TIGR01620 family protein [Aggregatibacter actinomycetemcomitans]
MDKKMFDRADDVEQQEAFIAKQEFREEQAMPDTEAENVLLDGELLEDQFEQSVQPTPRWWKRVLIGTAFLFLTATVAQSVQWLIDTWQQNQWIYFAFSLVLCLAVLLGLSAIIGEWRRLVLLRKRGEMQHQSRELLKSAVGFSGEFSSASNQQAIGLCEQIGKLMHLESQQDGLTQWRQQVNESYSVPEVLHLFSQNVLQSFDKQAKKLVNKATAESAALVAISPLALADMFFIAWRNIRLVNQIACLYGIELGYISRLRLLRIVLVNMAFAGATELIQDLGVNWLSQDLTAKLSARMAQGIGVGLLTARLGIKAMEFCRPLAFQADEKPHLSQIHKELLSHLGSTIFDNVKFKQKDKV